MFEPGSVEWRNHTIWQRLRISVASTSASPSPSTSPRTPQPLPRLLGSILRMRSQRAPLTPDTLLGISIGAAIARHQYDHDPTALLEEITRLADGRADILAQEAGRWAGYHEPDQESAAVVAALKQVPGADAWVQLGRDRRGAPAHGTAQFHPHTHE